MLTATVVLDPIARIALDQNASAIFPIDPRSAFVFDSGALLANAGSSDDLGFYQGTHGSGFPYIGTGDLKAVGAVTTRKCRFTFTLPHNYVAGGAVFIRAFAGMVTTIADVSATIDFEVFKPSPTAGAVITGSDLCLTAATSINDLTWGNKDFEIEGTLLVPGSQLDVLCSIAVRDNASATAVVGAMRPFFGCTVYG